MVYLLEVKNKQSGKLQAVMGHGKLHTWENYLGWLLLHRACKLFYSMLTIYLDLDSNGDAGATRGLSGGFIPSCYFWPQVALPHVSHFPLPRILHSYHLHCTGIYWPELYFTALSYTVLNYTARQAMHRTGIMSVNLTSCCSPIKCGYTHYLANSWQ